MAIVETGLLLVALAGHAVTWVGAVNRLHAHHLNRHLVDLITMLMGLALVGLPLVWLPLVPGLADWLGYDVSTAWRSTARGYELFSIVIAVGAVVQHIRQRRHSERVVSASRTRIEPIELADTKSMLAAGLPRLLGSLPGNEVLRPQCEEWDLRISGLPAAMDGFRIVHLSDFHMSGRIARRFYDGIVQASNRCRPDVIALTGDIVERSRCMNWIDESLSKLQAGHARCFVLGNHDLKVDCHELRGRLTALGWKGVGHEPVDLEVGGTICRIVGNERPWFPGPPTAEQLPEDLAVFRLALVHTPDAFSWAIEAGIDLMLAGHNHGGQIRFPFIGPIVAPSRHGTRYASGFFSRSSTVMHVSRGSGSLAPLRWNCPPAVTMIVLRCG